MRHIKSPTAVSGIVAVELTSKHPSGESCLRSCCPCPIATKLLQSVVDCVIKGQAGIAAGAAASRLQTHAAHQGCHEAIEGFVPFIPKPTLVSPRFPAAVYLAVQGNSVYHAQPRRFNARPPAV